MHSVDVTLTSRKQGFGNHEVRLSSRLYQDCVAISPMLADRWGIYELDRVDHLLQEAAKALSAYPVGTRSACFTHFRLPPEMDEQLPLAITIEAFVIERRDGDPYLLLAQRGEAHVAYAA
ncbi:hypothetical protein VO226_15660 [Halomonas elongata]|uniref:hypothetical protein n=1 Tax=Halomonas elongata TaxID=2746 RepID=UPI002E28564B|nr:hypothetical protein [Halomonas elongata]WVI71338.1 hypothetical protein VO226_15660 [Halomonas elongata]